MINVGRHKLIIKPLSAKTACGLKIVCFYPGDNSAYTDKIPGFSNGQLIEVTFDDKEVTCEKCK